MFNWLGTWLGGWFGSGDPAPPGSMSGVALVSVSTAATLTSTGSAPGMMSGTAALAISTTATITHATPVTTGNFWTDGFWSGGFWSDGFWGVFEQPYTELKPNLKLFVRTELHRIFAHTEVERIIAVAEANNLSILGAASALSRVVSAEGSQLTRTQRADKRTVSAYPKTLEATKHDRPNFLYAQARPSRTDVTTREAEIRVFQKTELARFIRTLPNTIATSRKRKTAVI